MSTSVLNYSQPLFQSFSASVVQLVLCRESRSFGLEVRLPALVDVSFCLPFLAFQVVSDLHFHKTKFFCLPPFRALSPSNPGTVFRIQMTVYYHLCQFLQFQLHHNPLPKYVCASNHSTTMPQFLDEYLSIYNVYVDLNLLVGVMTFTFPPLDCFYATIVEGGAPDRRRRPFLVYY